MYHDLSRVRTFARKSSQQMEKLPQCGIFASKTPKEGQTQPKISVDSVVALP
jgi:hypothetical protein